MVIVVLTVCVEMHPVNGIDGIYDAEQYLHSINNTVEFDRWTKQIICLSYCRLRKAVCCTLLLITSICILIMAKKLPPSICHLHGDCLIKQGSCRL